MEEREQLERAFEILKQFVCELSVQAGKSREYGEALWQGIRCSEGLLQELAYYHDYGEFLCKYEVAGHTLADVLVWQVDHFKLYMDRPELLLEAFDTMLQMEKEPGRFLEKMRCETGQDIL